MQSLKHNISCSSQNFAIPFIVVLRSNRTYSVIVTPLATYTRTAKHPTYEARQKETDASSPTGMMEKFHLVLFMVLPVSPLDSLLLKCLVVLAIH